MNNTLSITDFRNNLASTFDLTDAGEKVYIRRKNRLYTIVPVEDEELTITPALKAKIEKARQDFREGRTLSFKNAAEAQNWMDAL